jgi:hypothetical protein
MDSLVHDDNSSSSDSQDDSESPDLSLSAYLSRAVHLPMPMSTTDFSRLRSPWDRVEQAPAIEPPRAPYFATATQTFGPVTLWMMDPLTQCASVDPDSEDEGDSNTTGDLSGDEVEDRLCKALGKLWEMPRRNSQEERKIKFDDSVAMALKQKVRDFFASGAAAMQKSWTEEKTENMINEIRSVVLRDEIPFEKWLEVLGSVYDRMKNIKNIETETESEEGYETAEEDESEEENLTTVVGSSPAQPRLTGWVKFTRAYAQLVVNKVATHLNPGGVLNHEVSQSLVSYVDWVRRHINYHRIPREQWNDVVMTGIQEAARKFYQAIEDREAQRRGGSERVGWPENSWKLKPVYINGLHEPEQVYIDYKGLKCCIYTEYPPMVGVVNDRGVQTPLEYPGFRFYYYEYYEQLSPSFATPRRIISILDHEESIDGDGLIRYKFKVNRSYTDGKRHTSWITSNDLYISVLEENYMYYIMECGASTSGEEGRVVPEVIRDYEAAHPDVRIKLMDTREALQMLTSLIDYTVFGDYMEKEAKKYCQWRKEESGRIFGTPFGQKQFIYHEIHVVRDEKETKIEEMPDSGSPRNKNGDSCFDLKFIARFVREDWIFRRWNLDLQKSNKPYYQCTEEKAKFFGDHQVPEKGTEEECEVTEMLLQAHEDCTLYQCEVKYRLHDSDDYEDYGVWKFQNESKKNEIAWTLRTQLEAEEEFERMLYMQYEGSVEEEEDDEIMFNLQLLNV